MKNVIKENKPQIESHVITSHYKHHEKSGKVTIPFHKKPKDLSTKTLKSIFKQAGL
nr:MAG TPA: hypothetical protein [Caudoviricetes sp.]